ncbi:VOC family protein [Georgenia ruanii]|nr:VOC family protein [Georgenia ruanii]
MLLIDRRSFDQALEAAMLSAYNPVPTLAVKDLDAARKFYEDTLGLTPSEESMPDGVMYTAGSGQVFVYPSAYAGTNKATAVSFDVPTEKFDEEISALRGKVDFQTFDLPGATWEDGVARNDEMRSVWFADPDGNILNITVRL